MDLVVSVGTVVWHGGPMPSCLQMRAKSVGNCSFEERFCLPEVKNPGRKQGVLVLEAFLKFPLVYALLGPGSAGPGTETLRIYFFSVSPDYAYISQVPIKIRRL